MSKNIFHATTILAVRKNGETALGGDGQVSMGNTIVKGSAKKVRALHNNKIIAGFAGGTADAFTLFDKFEEKIREHPSNLLLAAVNLAKLWRSDRYLRRLEAMLLVADKERILTISGLGDVLEPEHSVMAIGSGGGFAQSAARALHQHSSLSAKEVVKESLTISGETCVYSNTNLTILTL
jgi:ATP-dependent HslUV protease subunit HslV